MTSPSIGYQGEPGAFSEAACQAFAPAYTPQPFASFDAVATALAAGTVEAAMLPVKNHIAGPVPGNAELVARHGFDVAARHRLPIEMQLMALPGTTLGDIDCVASHPMALKQCRARLASLGVRTAQASDTAGAARLLAQSGDRHLGVIAARGAAALYGLKIIAENIHDEPGNWTEFLLLRRADLRPDEDAVISSR